MDFLGRSHAWVAISLLKGIGPKLGIQLAQRWLELSTELPPQIDEATWKAVCHKAEQQLDRCQDLDIEVIGYGEDRYPKLLRLISHPPLVLYVQGSLPLHSAQIACVGTRTPTEWGKRCAHEIVHISVSKGYGIISGLALGIDGISHQACLQAGGQTWAVLGSGHEHLSPRQHHDLAKRILEQGGGLISEYAPHIEVHPGRLVARDRLQSALSLATIVIESDENGGAMHAAQAAQRQRRTLWVPQSPIKLKDHPKHRGLRYLRQHGAINLEQPESFEKALEQLHLQAQLLKQQAEESLTQFWTSRHPRLL